MKRILLPILTGAALLWLCACGGGSKSASASTPGNGTLTYTNPTNYQGQYALLLDPAATATNLVLDVVGPSTSPATPATGVTFAFDVDTTRAIWSSTTPFVNGNVFTALGTGTQLAKGWVAGARLQGIVSYKGLSTQVPDIGNGVLAKITLTPAPGAPAGTVSLVDSGLSNFMDNSGPPALPIQFVVGTLTCN